MEAVLLFLIDRFPDLLDLHLTVSIIILFILCVRQFLKRSPKIFSYALWGIVLLRLLVPVSIESSVSFVPERTEFSSMVELNEALPLIEFETPQDRADNEWRRENTPAGEPLAQVYRSLDAQTYLTFVWLFGFIVMLLRSLLSYWALRRKLRVTVPLRKGVFLADDIDTPFVMGIFRPRIYLPGTLEPAQRKYIIAHERHHIRRGDHIFKALGFLALSAHWFNPLVWVAFVLASRDMEMSCDEAVIRKLGPEVRAEYSATLLNLATGRRTFALTPLAFGEDDPMGRVRNLARWKKPALWASLLCVVLCAVLAVCLLTDPQTHTVPQLPQTAAQSVPVELVNDPLPEGFSESRDDAGNLIFTNGTDTVGGVLCYPIPEGLYDPEAHPEVLLYAMGIPDYMDPSLYFLGGMTSGDGWMAEFRSDVPEDQEPTVHRRHHFYPIGDVVYDIWFDMLLLDYETAESIRPCVNLPAEDAPVPQGWGVTLTPDRVSRTGATALLSTVGTLPEGAELTYGDYLALERWDGTQWLPCDTLAGYEYYVSDAAHPVADGYGMVHEWPDRFGQLADGRYRMGKLVTLTHADGTREERTVWGEFDIPGSILTGPIPREQLPELYSAEQAMIDGCFVSTDGTARENKDLFREFADRCAGGSPASIRLFNCSYEGEYRWNVMDLTFDGTVYTLTGDDTVYTFRHLSHFTGRQAWEGADHDGYEYYVLVNDDSLTLQDIRSGIPDTRVPDVLPHWTVFADYIYLPDHPVLPEGPARAALVFEGAELVATEDFDRLEKLWILFSEAEYLGYEPKTHSTGLQLELILTGSSGESLTLDLDPDSDICRIGGEFVFYGAFDEPDYIEKLWQYLGIPAWPDPVYEKYPNAYRGV